MGKNVSAKFLRNVQDLSLAGFKVVNESGEQDVNTIYKGYRSNIETLQRDLDHFQTSLDIKQHRLDRADKNIERVNKQLKEMREKKGFFVRFTKKYREKKRYLKELKKRKKELPAEIKEEYRKIKENRKDTKEAYKDLKDFEKFVNKLARDHVDEIQFIKYYQKNKAKLEKVYGDEQLESIKNCIELIKSGEEWQYNTSVWECLKELKDAVKTTKRFHFGKTDKNQKAVFGPAEEDKAIKEQDEKAQQERRNSFEGDLFSRGLANSQVIDRNQLEYAVKKYTRSPEEQLLIAGILQMEKQDVKVIVDALDNGTIADVTKYSADVYMDEGCKLMESILQGDISKEDIDAKDNGLKYAYALAQAYQGSEKAYKEYLKDKQQQRQNSQNKDQDMDQQQGA